MFSLPYMTSLVPFFLLPTVQSGEDWMASTFTCFILIAASAVLTAVRASGSPFACYVPQTYSGEWAQTAEVECFMKGLYFQWNLENHDSPQRQIPFDGAEPIRYYQWTAWYLCGLAGLSFLPKIIWIYLQQASGFRLILISEMITKHQSKCGNERLAAIKQVAALLLQQCQAPHSRWFWCCERMGLWSSYLLVKFLTPLIVLLHLFTLSLMFGHNYGLTFGWIMLKYIFIEQMNWETTGVFPRKAFCDFYMTGLSNNRQDQTIECALPLNEIVEKLIIFLWVYFILLAFFLICCLGNILIVMWNKRTYMKCLLRDHPMFKNKKKTPESWKTKLDKFISQYIRSDGVLVLYLLEKVDDSFVVQLTNYLFDKFLLNHHETDVENQLTSLLTYEQQYDNNKEIND